LRLFSTNSQTNCLWHLAVHACLLAIAFLALACRGGSTVSVRLMPDSDQTLEPGKALPISATLSNDPAGRGVNWTLSGQGALVARTTTSVMYQAPPNFSEGASVTVTATSVADGRKAVTLTIILVPLKRAISAHQNPRRKTEEGVRG
jgi:hypothetical protein